MKKKKRKNVPLVINYKYKISKNYIISIKLTKIYLCVSINVKRD